MTPKTYKGHVMALPANGIFVFGSNRQGRHGKGAALYAFKHFGARFGWAHGLQGKSYAIVTKDLDIPTTPNVGSGEIISQIEELYELAWERLDLLFYISYGNGPYLCGYTPQQMADMFSAPARPGNIVFEEDFAKLLIL